MKCCINGGNFITLLFLLTELFKFEIQKCGQILCAHKTYFLMLGHICEIHFTSTHLTNGHSIHKWMEEFPLNMHVNHMAVDILIKVRSMLSSYSISNWPL